MSHLTENHLKARLATNINQVKSPKFLRFCPLCVEDDRREFSETYWHRIHQLAGIVVCPDHQCFLQNSLVRWERQSSSFFHSAEEFINPESPCFINDKNPTHKIFLNLAKNAQWLLNQKELCLESGELRERYYNILLQRGFAYYNGKVRSEKLFKAFIGFFKSEVFDELECSLKSSYGSWLSKLTDKTYIGTFYHPIRHLLLLNFLEISPENFSSRLLSLSLSALRPIHV